MSETAWVLGDSLGLQIPAHSASLRDGGASFLTQAFRATGALAADNRVTRITRFEETASGGTGRKVVLSVAYEKPAGELHTELFVKFSRDFADPIRDRSRHLMELEVKFALLSRTPGFPVAVPECVFADYHSASGTGILITQRVPFGEDGIEPEYEKCFDYEIPNHVEHYRALIAALGRLAGTHKGGRLIGSVASQFPFDAHTAAANDRIPYSAAHLEKKLNRLRDFANNYPQLLPESVRAAAFLERLGIDAQRYLSQELPIREFLHGNDNFIALCHWNANIDNAWFWRNARGDLECGLLDWGRVNQMSIAQAIFGCLCAAETTLWDRHLDELLDMFVAEFRSCGGPAIDLRELKLHLALFTATMGLAWIMDAPSIVQSQVPELADITDRFDPRFKEKALARVQLQLLTVFLNAWQTLELGRVLDEFSGRNVATPARL
jgi:hypothetical protein